MVDFFDRKENGQWLKSIEFKLPIIEKEFISSLDNDTQNETVCLLSNRKPDTTVKLSVDMVDYYRIKDGKEPK